MHAQKYNHSASWERYANQETSIVVGVLYYPSTLCLHWDRYSMQIINRIPSWERCAGNFLFSITLFVFLFYFIFVTTFCLCSAFPVHSPFFLQASFDTFFSCSLWCDIRTVLLWQVGKWYCNMGGPFAVSRIISFMNAWRNRYHPFCCVFAYLAFLFHITSKS